MKGLTRRWFIGGAASFGAFGGARLFAADGFRAGRRANLTFGVVSDLHVSATIDGPEKSRLNNLAAFRHALEQFRAAGVDAVVIAGDMANSGAITQLEAVASAWREVFPNDRLPDGRCVEKLFVTGNHDMGGLPHGRPYFKGLPDDEVSKRIIFTDPKAVWERVFGEPYAPIWKKEVKGYAFVGAQWLMCDCRGKDEPFNPGIPDFYAAEGKSFDPKRPFFHIQHAHPKDTCYGPWAWGRDEGLSTKALSAFPNAIALSGHSHYTLTDPRSVWQGAFTSVGTSSLRYIGDMYNEFPPRGFENSGTDWRLPDGWRVDAEKLTPRKRPSGQQGMIWRVYDDSIVVERRDYQFDQALGEDWVIPLESSDPRPFAFAERARKSVAPQFASGAGLTAECVKAKNRGGKTAKGEVPVAEQAAVKVAVPPVAPDRDARVYRFEITARGGDVTKTMTVVASGSANALEHADVKKPTECLFAAGLFPAGEVTVTATPIGWFGRRGRSLTAKVKVS